MPRLSNIERFNAERHIAYESKVLHELATLDKKKVRFDCLGALAMYLQERTGVHRTTLTRTSSSYRHLLLKYLADQPGAIGFVKEASLDASGLRVRVALQSTEIGRLRRRVRQLELQLQAVAAPDGKSQMNDVSSAYVLVCELIRRAETFIVDKSASTIIDLAAPPGQRQVCGSERVRPFLVWLGANRALPVVSALKIK